MSRKPLLRSLLLTSLSFGLATVGVQLTGLAAQASEAKRVPLLPLEARYAEIESEAAELSTVAADVNDGFADEQARQAALATEGVLQFEDIPVIGDLFTASGELSATSGLPVSVSVGSVMSSYGAVIRQEMDMTRFGTSTATTPPIER